MKNPIVATLLLPALALAACSGLAQSTPTPVPTWTFTAVPTATPAPTSTPLPPTETPDVASGLAPEGMPASEWQGIPIMPGAIAGEGDEEGYVFTVKATAQQVQEYYNLELGKLGWHVLAQTEGKSTSLMLIFTNDTSETLTVSIIAKGAESLVLLVK
ncbi:MAG TPA: hypothetical protein VLE49_04535 [Anaerolineales bacterium]|nr:hypothetical protein [Anaerolineales bacterium]